MMAYTGRLRTKGVPFRLQVYERVETSLVEVYKKVRKSVMSVRARTGLLREGFYGCKKANSAKDF